MIKTRKRHFSMIKVCEEHTIEKAKKKEAPKIHFKKCKQMSTAVERVEKFKRIIQESLITFVFAVIIVYIKDL